MKLNKTPKQILKEIKKVQKIIDTNGDTFESFFDYHRKHPELRFWQCLLSWVQKKDKRVLEINLKRKDKEWFSYIDTFHMK